MNLCLSCHHLSPSGSIYCGTCGRTFGARVCHGKKHHHNPMDAQVCIHCGTQDLSEATYYVPFGWLTRLLTWGTVLLLLWWTGPWMLGMAGGLVSQNRSLMGVFNGCLHWFIFLALWYWLLSWMLSLVPGEAGKQLRSLVFGTLHLFTKQGSRLLLGVARGAFQVVHTAIEGHKSGKS